MVAIPLTIVIGGPLAGYLLDMDGLGGLHGWQWLFLIEGLPAVILGVVVFFIRRDARQHGLSWWWILLTFPFMPMLGLLAYFIARRRQLIGLESRVAARVSPRTSVA